MDLGLTKKAALVVASSTGLGYATARQLAREGASVALCSRSAERLAQAEARLAAEVGPDIDVAAFVCDVTDKAQIDQLVADVHARFGRLDILVTNAGGPPGGTFGTTELDAWRHAVDLILMSVVHLVQAALPHLQASDAASVLTVTSVSVKQPIDGLLLSNVLRPAVAGLTKSLSQELGSHGIRVNSILPGWTATDRVGEILDYRAAAGGTTAGSERAKIAGTIPLGRMGDPAEFGNVAAFLVSPAASYVTGVMMQVDGGRCSGLL